MPLYPQVCWLLPKNRGLFYMTTIQLLKSHLYFKMAQWVTLLILACQVTENPLWDGILFFILNSCEVCPLFSRCSQTLKRGPCHLASLCSYSCTQMSVYTFSVVPLTQYVPLGRGLVHCLCCSLSVTPASALYSVPAYSSGSGGFLRW